MKGKYEQINTSECNYMFSVSLFCCEWGNFAVISANKYKTDERVCVLSAWRWTGCL